MGRGPQRAALKRYRAQVLYRDGRPRERGRGVECAVSCLAGLGAYGLYVGVVTIGMIAYFIP